MSKAQEDLDRLMGLAEDLGLEESEAENFVSSAMKRLGHRAKMTWEDGEPSGDSGSGDFFSGIAGGKRRETRATRPTGQRRSSDGWQYGRSA